MENELFLLKNEEFEYPELDLEVFVAEDVLTERSESNIEQGDYDDPGGGEVIGGDEDY